MIEVEAHIERSLAVADAAVRDTTVDASWKVVLHDLAQKMAYRTS